MLLNQDTALNLADALLLYPSVLAREKSQHTQQLHANEALALEPTRHRPPHRLTPPASPSQRSVLQLLVGLVTLPESRLQLPCLEAVNHASPKATLSLRLHHCLRCPGLVDRCQVALTGPGTVGASIIEIGFWWLL